MGRLFLNNDDNSSTQKPQAYRETARGLVRIHGAPADHSGFLEQITGVDTAVQIHSCILPWALVYHQRLDAEELKRSLSVVLGLHPSISGRVRTVPLDEVRRDKYKRRFQIDHNNGGVEFIEAVGSVKLSSLPHRVVGRELIHPLRDQLPLYVEGIDWQRMMQGKEPFLKVKLTQTADGGSILGVSFAHVIVDGRSFVSFMHAWASEYTDLGRESVGQLTNRPFHNRLVLQPSTIEASLRRLQHQHPSTNANATKEMSLLHETNPFLVPTTKKSVDKGQIYAEEREMDVASAMRDMQREHLENIPACVISGIPKADVFGAVGNVLRFLKSFRVERQRFPNLWSELKTEILYVPQSQIDALKSKAVSGCHKETKHASTNDVLSALLWTLVCDLRQRPLPGSDERSVQDAGHLCMAVDLRKNGLEHCVPHTFFGNASWFLNISGCKGTRPHENNPFLQMIHEEVADPYHEAFVSATRRIRRGVMEFRTKKEVPLDAIRMLYEKNVAHWLSRVMVTTDQMLKCDALITNWQFPLWDIDFGCGSPKAFHGMFQNAPPFSAILIPEQHEDNGYYISLTIPKAASSDLRSNAALQQLAPETKFLS